jgi:hypothetical protein
VAYRWVECSPVKSGHRYAIGGALGVAGVGAVLVANGTVLDANGRVRGQAERGVSCLDVNHGAFALLVVAVGRLGTAVHATNNNICDQAVARANTEIPSRRTGVGVPDRDGRAVASVLAYDGSVGGQ